MTDHTPSKMPARILGKTYDPRASEPRIYQFWLDNGLFSPKAVKDAAKPNQRPFSIALPPPNITGELHIGHALCYLAQDIGGRRARMQGRPTLLLPGMDHAGIATQNVVERQLAAEGLSRHDLGRADFEARCWAFVEATMPTIRRQFQRLGFSFDWSRERFTLDPDYQRAVNRAFAHFFGKGWIYRGYRLVNWCPRCATSISDLEVEHVERLDNLYTIEYPVPAADAAHPASLIRVATTRPETMLGDTAVAVHPDDARYAPLIGRTAILPLLGRRLPIIADEAVDRNFGTGAVKVTPAHDPVDYDLGERHGLDFINVVGEDGRMTEEAGPYAGLTPAECRQAVLDALERQGHLIRQEPYQHSLGTCERCHTTIEPLMSRQWFLKMDHLAGPGIAAVRSGRVTILPERWERVYLHWMENIRDWCISRQLWWGHRIPVWTCADCGAFSSLSEDGAPPRSCEGCGSPRLAQETDVLDTWFSSALWPFASLGWPAKTEDLRRYYPGALLGTAGEIIFLWVARMIMEGIEFVGQEPFAQVYINPTVLAEDGRRMSKSLGTGVDPLVACDEYGADAIRWALIRDNTLAQTVRFSPTRADEGRRFANKLWNAARFILSKLRETPHGTVGPQASGPLDELSLPERWIRSRLSAAISACDAAYEGLRFDLAAQALYECIWGELCDWYLEIAKHQLNRSATHATLHHCLDTALRLLHPLMPYVTEEIWAHLNPGRGAAQTNALILATWPGDEGRDPAAEAEMDELLALIRQIRNARATLRVPLAQRTAATITAGDKAALLTENLDWLAPLARLDEAQLRVQPADGHPVQEIRSASTVTAGPFTCYLPQIDRSQERKRLESELEAVARRIAHSESLLAGAFGQRAPDDVVQRERDKLDQMRAREEEISERLTNDD